MKKQYVDLRRSKRLTLKEARAIVDLVEFINPTSGRFSGIKGAVKKLKAALLIANHDCVFRDGECRICTRPEGFQPYNPREHLLKAQAARAKHSPSRKPPPAVLKFPTRGGAG